MYINGGRTAQSDSSSNKVTGKVNYKADIAGLP